MPGPSNLKAFFKAEIPNPPNLGFADYYEQGYGVRVLLRREINFPDPRMPDIPRGFLSNTSTRC
jgi:hypothetical protein